MCEGGATVASKQPGLLGSTNLFDDRLQWLGGHVAQIRFVPTLLHPCEGQLHAADVRDDLEAVLAQTIAKIASQAEEQRVAAGQHHHASVARGCDLVNNAIQVTANLQPLRLTARKKSECVSRSHQQLRILNHSASGSGHPFRSVRRRCR